MQGGGEGQESQVARAREIRNPWRRRGSQGSSQHRRHSIAQEPSGYERSPDGAMGRHLGKQAEARGRLTWRPLSIDAAYGTFRTSRSCCAMSIRWGRADVAIARGETRSDWHQLTSTPFTGP